MNGPLSAWETRPAIAWYSARPATISPTTSTLTDRMTVGSTQGRRLGGREGGGGADVGQTSSPFWIVTDDSFST